MSRLLVDLLGVKEREFRGLIDRLEDVCMQPSLDIRLSAEIITKTREKARALGLDAGDTTPKEMFFALKGRLEQDDMKLKKALKIDGKNPEQIAKALSKTAHKLSAKEKVLCLTSAGSKRVLEAVPPRKTLRALKLRSLSSVLKREDPKALYALAAHLEDESWRSQVHAKMKRLQSKDITWQSVTVTTIPAVWFSKIEDKIKHHGIQIVCPDTGSVVVLPVIKHLAPGSSVLALGLILQSAQRLSVDSLPYRRAGFMQGYSTILQQIAHGEHTQLATIHGLAPSWRAVHELVSRGLIVEQTPEIVLSLNDLSWQSTEMKLASIVSEFDFWVDTHYLASKADPKPVSLHLLDVARAVVVSATYGEQSVIHLEGSLWNELQIRYLHHDSLSKYLVSQLRPTQEDVIL